MNDAIHFLIFRLNERSYGVRLSQAQRVVRSVDCTPVPNTTDLILGVIDVHGEIIPVLNLRERFGFESREVETNDLFVIARTSRRTVALMVDGIVGIIEHSLEEITATESILPGADQIDGVIRCKDELVLIHDLDRFLSWDDEENLEHALMERPEHAS